jgi:phage-related protein
MVPNMVHKVVKRVPAIFYRTNSSNEPVRDWLKAMSAEDRRRIGEDIKTVEYGWPIGMPVCRPMGGGVHEVRSDLSGKRIARVFFFIDRDQRMVLLHGIVKKTRTTPAADLDLARANKRRYERGYP